MDSSQESAEKKPFPLNTVAIPEGWVIVVLLESGEPRQLLKPGWDAENNQPYIFASEGEAWGFIRQLFMFCIKQGQLQCGKTDKVLNCQQCGRVIRVKFFEYCSECLQENEFMFQQIWQGFYYMTGDQESALHKMSLLLKMAKEDFQQVPEAFQSMIQRQLEFVLQQERQMDRKLQKDILKMEVQKSSGLRSSRNRFGE